MVFHLASTSLAIIFANIYSPNIRSFSFKNAFHYIILCRYYKTYIAPTGDTNIRAPDALPENVRRYLCGALGVSDERIEYAWSAPSFRDYIWKSYNSRTETQMSERIIYKARKRGVHFDPDVAPHIKRERTDSSWLQPPLPEPLEDGHMRNDNGSGCSQVGHCGDFVHQAQGIQSQSRVRIADSPVVTPDRERRGQSSAQANAIYSQGSLNNRSFHEGHIGRDHIGSGYTVTPNRRRSAENDLDIGTAHSPVLDGLPGIHEKHPNDGPELSTAHSVNRVSLFTTKQAKVQFPNNISPPPPERTAAQLLKDALREQSYLDLTIKVKVTDEAVAYGGFAEVDKGVYTDGQNQHVVAIKRLHLNMRANEKIKKDVARELRIWSELKHPNVLPLLGYIMTGSDYPAFVSEWMEEGSLRDCSKSLKRPEALSMALGIAKGLAYLHSKGVIHSDLKSDNVLVSRDKQALLTDFGISRMESLSNGYSTESSKGNARWQAREFLQFSEGQTSPKHTFATDIWAFGMTIYELLSYDLPYAAYKDQSHVILAISKGFLPSRPKVFDGSADRDRFIEDGLWAICERCWDSVPDKRPRISDIVSKDLEDIQKKVERWEVFGAQTT